jgi:hypothetical protein
MSSRRRSVQEAVRVIIRSNPYLYRGIRMQVINYSAAARYIQEDVEDLAGDEVEPNTIVTAIMRFSREALEVQTPQQRESLQGSRINLITDIKDITIKASRREQADIIEKLLEMERDGLFIRIHQFQESLKILTTSDSMTKLMQEFWQYEPVIDEGFAELNVTLRRGQERADQIALLVDLLFRNGVQMFDVFYSPDEVSLIISEEYASRAFEVLRSNIG